jgi:hypothetical protein
MNMQEASRSLDAGELVRAELMRNPKDRNRWFLTLLDSAEKRYFLVDSHDEVETYVSIEDAMAVSKLIGFRTVILHL